MQEINIEDRLTDISDVASRNEQMDLAMRLAAQRMAARTREQPDEDEQGNRYCLDCGDDIPPERVKAVDAVRCVVCAGKRERMAKIGRQHGGAGRAVPFPTNPGEEENSAPQMKEIDDD